MPACRFVLIICLLLPACGSSASQEREAQPDSANTVTPYQFVVLDPGHFHAALVQKSMYQEVNPVVHVFAPDGPDVRDYLQRVEAYNGRVSDPTAWQLQTHLHSDYFQNMLSQRPGNILTVAGNNRLKTDYIVKSIEAGINVYADKPMIIDPQAYDDLERAFEMADEKGLLLYDIMTERFEITSLVQKALVADREVFGELETGTPDDPAVRFRSVHHFYKLISGNPIVRPTWFFDPAQQGEAIVDVGTHLVDLAQWMCFPDVVLDTSDVQVLSAERWPTVMTPEEFGRVTGGNPVPPFLQSYVSDGVLHVYQNNRAIYALRGVHMEVIAEWAYEAAEGGDTHEAVVRGTMADLEIRQGATEDWRPEVYVIANNVENLEEYGVLLKRHINQLPFGQLDIDQRKPGEWRIVIPDGLRVGHEAHFAQVTNQYLDYLHAGRMPEWEVPNMLVKYWTTTRALQLARQDFD